MSLTKVSFSMIQDGFVDVRDFGAACDWNGSSGTDDTAAIQAAINYGIANHKAVFFPGMSKITNSIVVAPDTRGLQIFGVDRRNTGIHNANTSGSDALVIGDNVTDTYDISIHDFRIEGNGSYTDGKGLAMYLCHNCQIQNVMTEFTGSHGISLVNVNQSTVINTHTRRAGFNTGVSSIAGLRMVGNSGLSIYNHVSDECSCGVYCDTGGFYFDGLDTDFNQLGGLRVVGESLIQIVNGYAESGAGGSNSNWYIGDGTNKITYAFLRNGAIGNGSYIYLNKVSFYEIDSYDLGASVTGEIFITNPLATRGRITNIWPRGANTLNPDKATFIQHTPINPIKLTSFNNLLGDNGSFEQDLTTNWTKNWYGTAGTVVVSDVAGLGYDIGSHACQLVVSSSPSTYYVRPTYPTTTAGRFYTLEFDYFSNGTLIVTCTTGGVRHFNFPLPNTTSDGLHYRIIFLAQGTIDTLEFELQSTGTYKIDGVMLYEGLYGQT
jgi:hypothetical protein